MHALNNVYNVSRIIQMGKLSLYIDYFKDKLFSKKENRAVQVDLEEIKNEKWVLDFSKDVRFDAEETDDYATVIDRERQCIEMTAKRKNVYAWTIDKHFRYDDFALDFTVDFDEEGVKLQTDKAGTCAAGVLFRYLNQGVFYALLVSDHGWVRMDVMINGSPFTVLAWTQPVQLASLAGQNSMRVKLIAVGTSFHILVNDNWVATVSNDVIQSAGKIAVAVQNWEHFSQCTCRIKNIVLNSEINPVENLDTEAMQKADSDYAAHINLAKTFYAMGKPDLASAEINKAESVKPLEAEDAVTAGRIFFFHGRIDEAERAFKLAIKSDRDNPQLLEELGGLYYYTEQFEKLGKFLESTKEKNEALFDSSVILQNFAGHYCSHNGEHEKAATYYEKAFSAKPDEGLFALNAASEYEKLLDTEKAYTLLLKAGYAFLKKENYVDLASVVDKLEVIKKDDEQSLSLLGKFYFGVENFEEALPYFQKLCETLKTKDAGNWYLYALLIKNADAKKYIAYLKKAVKLDSKSSLYLFRLAEAEFAEGIDCRATLDKSLALDENNAWAHNLKALVDLKEARFDEALASIEAARKILPDEIALLTNYVEIKRKQGRLNDVLPLFDLDATTVDLAVERNRGEAFHILANAFYNDGNFETADVWYKNAEKLVPQTYDFLVNHAQNSMELGFLNEADMLLVKALELQSTAEVYRLIARLCTLKGNYLRAKATVDEALTKYPDDADILFDLAIIQTQFNKKTDAEATYKKLAKLEKSERVKDLKQKISALN